MKWSKRSDYSIGSGQWIICRTVHGGRDIYTLWLGWDSWDYHSSAEAKKAAKKKVKKRVDVFNSATHNEHSKTETLNEASGE